ncbi:MAG: ADP-ribosylation factor-like protein [Candidatus Hermodarchaeota archaeon]
MSGGWVNKRELSSHIGYKILLAGLSEAGKTSIKRIFFYKHKTTDVENLPATIDYERKSLSVSNTLITIVDLGGQQVFIKRFLDKISPFIFSSVHILIFVIDVAEKSTLNDAIKYFRSCIELLQQYSPNAKLFVFLHKNDLVRLSPNYESIHAQLKEQFQLQSSKRVAFLRTTIYDPKTIVDSFGRVFELSIPQIGQSDYVDGRIIGEIEEYSSKFAMVEIEGDLCQKCGLTLSETEDGWVCNFCGYIPPVDHISETAMDAVSPERGSVTVDELETLLQKLDVTDGVTEEISTPPHPVAAQQVSENRNNVKTVRLEDLQNQLDDLLIKETAKSNPADLSASTNNSVSSEPRTQTSAELKREEEVGSPRNTTPSSSTVVQAKELEMPGNQISFLTSFYGLKEEEAEQLVKSGYREIFETTAKAGVPINLLLNVFLKYLPYLAKNGLSIKGLETKLIETLFAHLSGFVKREEIFKCLIFVIKFPDMSIEAIVREWLVKLREEKEKVKTRPAERPREDVPTSAQIESRELEADILPLSSREPIGFTLKQVGNNCELTFYYNNQRISCNLVSRAISINELKYLLIFETELPLKENYKEFAEAAAPIILNALEKLFGKKS